MHKVLQPYTPCHHYPPPIIHLLFQTLSAFPFNSTPSSIRIGVMQSVWVASKCGIIYLLWRFTQKYDSDTPNRRRIVNNSIVICLNDSILIYIFIYISRVHTFRDKVFNTIFSFNTFIRL